MATNKEDRTNMQPEDVKNFRAHFRMTQKDLAELLGITWQAVALWESHQRRVPETTARLLLLFRKKPELMNGF